MLKQKISIYNGIEKLIIVSHLLMFIFFLLKEFIWFIYYELKPNYNKTNRSYTNRKFRVNNDINDLIIKKYRGL